MKLTEGKDPTENRLPESPFSQYFGNRLSQIIFATTPDPDTHNVRFEQNGRFTYKEAPNEQTFYQEKYIPLYTLENEPNVLIPLPPPNEYFIAEELNNKIGRVERSVLDFIYEGGHRLVITGKKGWGKTTLLRYLAFHVIPTLNKNERNKSCIPLYISFNTKLVEIAEAKSPGKVLLEEYHKIFYEKLLLNEIRMYCENRLREEITNDFYQYVLSQKKFSKQKRAYEDIKHETSRGWITSDERDRRWHYLRKEIAETEEAVLFTLSYLNQKNAIPILILDDLDPCDTDFQAYIYEEVFKLAHEEGYKIKVITTMRPRSYERVCQRTVDALRCRTLALSSPMIKLYLKNSGERIIEGTIDTNRSLVINNYTIKSSEIHIFFMRFLSVLLHKEAVKFISELSDGDLRMCNEYIHIYLSSGYIKPDDTFVKMMQRQSISLDVFQMKPTSSSDIPLWIVYSSILTNNHQTVFGQRSGLPNNYVVNILCNGTTSYNTLLLRLHILSYFMHSPRGGHVVSIIKRAYKMLLPRQHDFTLDMYDIDKDIERVLKRFVNARLTGDSNRWQIRFYDSITDEDEFYLENLGIFYYKEMVKIFDYFSFMKDDMALGANHLDIRSCIEVTRPIDRLKEVVKYLHLLYDVEQDFYNKLESDQKNHYKRNFAPIDGRTFYTQVFVENMIAHTDKRENSLRARIQDPSVHPDMLALTEIKMQLNELKNKTLKQ